MIPVRRLVPCLTRGPVNLGGGGLSCRGSPFENVCRRWASADEIEHRSLILCHPKMTNAFWLGKKSARWARLPPSAARAIAVAPARRQLDGRL
jgi:hypothetical protein